MKKRVTRSESKRPVIRDILTSWAPDGGFQFGASECPWIPGNPGTWNKFMLFDLRHNSFVTLFKINPGCRLPPHFHAMPVVGYVLQGVWKYDEYDWVARPGSMVYEPAGEVHTLVNIGRKPMISVFHVTGPHLDVDEKGRVLNYVDANAALVYTRDYCRMRGIDDSFIARITR